MFTDCIVNEYLYPIWIGGFEVYAKTDYLDCVIFDRAIMIIGYSTACDELRETTRLEF